MKKHVVFQGDAILLGLLIPVISLGEDWPQWRGPDRNDISPETNLLKTWPDQGPRQVWVSEKAGLGYSGPAVVGSMLYTMGAEGDKEFLKALNIKDGTLVWESAIGELLNNGWGDGPRSTPTVDGDFVYALSGRGNLVCCSRGDGRVVWSKSMEDLGGKVPGWGYTESVLVDGNNVYCTPGGKKGAIAALKKSNGDLVWQSKDFTDEAQYSSIILINHNGARQLIQLTMSHVAGINAANGELLWQSDWPGRTAVIPTPIFHDGLVYVTSGYGVGCKLIKIGPGNQTEEVYENKVMKNHHGGVVLVGKYLYGYSDGGGWVCQDLLSGEEVWSNKEALGKGCVTYADGNLIMVEEGSGTVVMAAATPEGWREKGRFKLEPQSEQRSSRGKIWTHPVISNGKLYLRDQEFVVCYDVGS